MPKKKSYKSKVKSTEANEPQVDYGSNRITITTFEELEKMDIESARKRSYNQRMEYLQQLRGILHDTNSSEYEKKYFDDRIKTRKFE
ncbi:MAG: hypothetical protein ABI723_01100 [Bacteroidia bacterium]